MTKGYTLIEVLVAMLVFSVAMLFGLSFFVYGQKHMVNARETTCALQYAKDEIETFKARGYNYPPVSPQPQVKNVSGINYKVYTSVFETPSSSIEKYKIITVTVTWTNQGRTQDISLHTIIAPKN